MRRRHDLLCPVEHALHSDAATVGLFHFNEGAPGTGCDCGGPLVPLSSAGTCVTDSSSYARHAECRYGFTGNNGGPVYSASTPFDSEPAPCGNGVLDSGEECDDGNTAGGDGCSSSCTAEPGGCGNGILDLNEECDDGDTVPGDGCSSVCTLETIDDRLAQCFADLDQAQDDLNICLEEPGALLEGGLEK